MQTYLYMEDSKIAWLGDIPTDWNKKRAKYLFAKTQDKPLDEDKVVTAFRDGEVVLRSLRREDGFTFADKEIGYQHVRQGDLVIHAMDAFAGAIGVSKSNGKMSPVCSICRPITDDADTMYFSYLLKAMTRTNYLIAIAKGIRERSTDFRYSDFGNMILPVPPIQIQKRIVSYIEFETAKIDNLIAKQERLLGILEEKRRATITHTVGRGINPNVGMKPTSTPWLAMVPEHWDISKLKYVSRISTGDKDTVDAKDEGIYPFFVRSQTPERIDTYTRDCEAILTAGDGAGVGKVFHYFKGKFDFHQRVYLIENFTDIQAKYVFYFLKENFYKVALEGRAKSTVDSVRMPWLQDFVIPLPPQTEQKEIIDYCDTVTDKFEKAKLSIITSIALLKERRASIIFHAVTGKIKI